MSRSCSLDELYTAFGTLVESSSGRQWWRKAGIQAQPKSPYATLFFTEGADLEQQVVESIELVVPGPNGEVFEQTPWGTMKLDCTAEFYRSDDIGTAMHAATRFRQSLRLEERFWDVWQICGLVGPIRTIDISAIFRADVEPRAEVRFSIYANVADPMPLADSQIFDIQSDTVNIDHVGQDDVTTTIPIIINA